MVVKVKLRNKLFILLIAVSLIPLLLMMSVTISRLRDTQRISADTHNRHVAQLAAEEIQTFILLQFRVLDNTDLFFLESFDNSKIQDIVLERALFSNDSFSDIVLVDANGQEINRKNQLLVITEKDLIDRSNKEEFLVTRRNERYIGPLSIKRGRPVFIIGKPIFDTRSNFKGAIFAEVDARVMQDVVRDISVFREEGRAYVVNNKGTIIAHPDLSQVLREKDFSSIPVVSELIKNKTSIAFPEPYINDADEEVLGVGLPIYVSFDDKDEKSLETRWFVVSEREVSIALADVHKITEFALFALLGAIILAFGSALVFSKRIVNPIEILHEAMIDFGRGLFKSRVDLKSIKTRDEIKDLAGGFNNMADDLSDAITGLEHEREIIVLEKNKLEIVLSGIEDSVISIDEKMNIITFNTAAEKITGYKEDDVLGKRIDSIIKLYDDKTELSVSDYCPIGEKEGKTSFLRANLKLIGFQNKESFVNGASGFVESTENASIKCIIVFHDITKELVVEKVKKEFVSLAAHQLRTPITSLKWLVDMFLKGGAGEVSSSQKNLLEKGSENIKIILRLIDRLLDVATIEEGRYHYQKKNVDIVVILREVIKEYNSQIKIKNLKFYLNLEKEVHSMFIDPITIKMAFENILENAIKYTKEGGQIEVSVQEKNGEIAVSTKDNGIGITVEESKSIFVKFFRGKEAVLMETVGSGIGLYMVKNIIESHGGKVWFESEGNGTTVTFSIPINKIEN